MSYNFEIKDRVESDSHFRLAPEAPPKTEDYLSSFEDFLLQNPELSQEMRNLHEASKQFKVDPILIKNIEIVCICIYQILRSRNKPDVILAITSALNNLSGRSVILEANRYLYELITFIGDNIQARFNRLLFQSGQKEDEYSFDILDSLSFLDDSYEKILGSKLVANLTKLNNYLISFGLWSYFGLSGSITDFSEHELIFIQKNFKFGPSFFHTLFKTTLDLSRRIMILYKTGKYSSFFDDSSQISEWLSESRQLISDYALINAGANASIDIFTARKKMVVLSEQGRKLLKWSNAFSNFEKNVLRSTISELETVYRKDLSIISAMQTRKVPFSVLIHGTSGVGKSVLVDLIYQHYGKTFGLEIDSEYKFSKNPAAKFWDNFKSHQWCVVLDDIAFVNPSISQGIDPTLQELLQIVNNVPYVVDQASLADKGTTPMQARLCIATTNTMNLNVHAYFSFPVAVSRRLPFIVTVTVKDEFATNGMLDPSKIPATVDGEYPNIWNFLIHKVIVKKENCRNPDYVELEKFTCIDDFLSWFSKEAIKHDKNQEQVLQNKVDTSTVAICDVCYRAKVKCNCLRAQCSSPYCDHFDEEVAFGVSRKQYTDTLQKLSDELNANEKEIQALKEELTVANTFGTLASYMVQTIVLIILGLYNCVMFCAERFSNRFVKKAQHITLFGYRVYLPQCIQILVVKCAFLRLEQRLFHSNWKEICFNLFTRKRLMQIVAILSFVSLGYVALRKLMKKKPAEQQGLSASLGCKPKPDIKPSAPNVWKNDNFEVCSLDLTRASASAKGLSFEKFKNMILANCHSVILENIGSNVEICTRAVCLTGNIYVMNYHSLQGLKDTFLVRLIGHTNNVGVNDSCTMTIKRKEILEYPDRDLCFVKLAGVPAKKSITKYLARKSFNGVYKGELISRYEHGALYANSMKSVRLRNNIVHYDTGVEKVLPTWEGTPNLRTKQGDCGSALILDCPIGYIFAGIHCAGVDNRACSVPIFQEDIDVILNFFKDNDWSKNVMPINSETTNWTLEPLHVKSPIRFIEQSGSANVYGSFQGGLVKNKSRVGPTAFRKSMQKLGYKVKYGPPELASWMPKRIALLDVLTIKKNIPLSDIKLCADAYFNDIVKMLQPFDLECIQVLDDDSVINGVPGVKFLDRIKLNTSTGMPWNKKKRAMIKEERVEDGQLHVSFDDEIMKRVDLLLENYKEGNLNAPIFCAHLKDEPVSEKKQRTMKTRVFCGAPLDFTIVVRKFYLGAIRCMQNNPFVFEAAPGVNHNSKQWQDFAGYLTHFGCDQIIAGDYAAYDKNMAGYVIYEAFNVIIKLAELNGASPETIKIMRGIAQDTSYPTVNFFGDLVQFFGSNPSGHPLTVTINGIVNSIYMRYAFMTLHPEHKVEDFKKYVHLMTYGDDNIMGVSRDIPWFNHTAIAKVLAQAGITYTMADKDAESVPYSHISEVNFLKRGFRFDPILNIVQAPLAHESIEKTLTTCVYSKSVALEQQSVDAMTSCLCEYFQYGKHVYNNARATFMKVLEEEDLLPWVQDHNMPIYEDLVKRYDEASLGYEVKWPLATGHERELTPKLLNDNDPCFLRMGDIPEKDT